MTKILRYLPLLGALFAAAALIATPKWDRMSHAHQVRAILILGAVFAAAEITVWAATRNSRPRRGRLRRERSTGTDYPSTNYR